MKTLRSFFSKAIVDEHRDGWFSSFKDFSRAESCLLPRKKVVSIRFLHTLSVQYKHVRPILTSSHLSPDSQVGLERAESESGEENPSKTIHVKFQLQRECSFGQQFVIVGDHPMFGSWDPESAIPMNWSEGHVWTVELDVPVEKSILFKFILKTKTGTLVWQPGPDRIFKSWESEKTIIVQEDWEEAQNQKVMEEEPLINQDEAVLDLEMTVVTEDSDRNKLVSDIDSSTNSEKEPLQALTEELATENGATSLEKPLPIVADNISNPTDGFTGSTNNGVLGGKTTNYPNDEASAVHHQKDLGNISGVETNADVLVAHEGSPILVPGLTPTETLSTEEAIIDEDEKSSTNDASVGVDEAKYHNFPELEEKQEPKGQPHGEETIAVSMEEETQLESQEIPKPQLEIEESPAPEPFQSNDAFQNDVQWGRKTLQKLLSSLRFL